MPAPIEGVLTAAQRESLEISDFIFHIIDPDNLENDEGVIYLDSVELQDRQKRFFLDRLRDIAEGTQYIFKEDAVHLKEKCQDLIQEEADFVKLSRQVTADFAGRHEGQMSAGVFVIAVVRYLEQAHAWKKLVLLLKMDKGASFSYSYTTDQNGKRTASMAEVENALNENKSAIQKSAVIDVSDVFAWDVLAYDRVTKPYLADYYKAFLGVTERQADSLLTRTAHTTVRKWARQLTEEDMPDGQDAFDYIGRSLNYLADHDTFDTDAFLNAIVRDENAENKARLISMLRADLVESGVAGQQFVPRPGSLPNRIRRQIYQTAEGVTITFEGDKDAHGLQTDKLPDGRERVTIETQRLTQKT